jgi:hypothetical protein
MNIDRAIDKLDSKAGTAIDIRTTGAEAYCMMRSDLREVLMAMRDGGERSEVCLCDYGESCNVCNSEAIR